MSPTSDPPLAELRVEHFGDVEPHLLADISPAHCDGDEDEAQDHAHRQAEDDFAADADGQLPESLAGMSARSLHGRAACPSP